MNKRVLPILFFMGCLLTQANAWAAPSMKELKQTIAQQATQARPQTLDNTWYGLPIISYEDFEKANEKERKTNEEFTYLQNKLIYYSSREIAQGLPDYAKLAKDVGNKDVRYIYIGEYHDEPAIEREIKAFITAIGQQNPGQKILLATEFARISHPLRVPLHHVKKNSNFIDDFYGIKQFAKKQKMDILALDDIIFQKTNNGFLMKVGNQYVRESDSEQLHRDIKSLFEKEILQRVEFILLNKKELSKLDITVFTKPDVFLNNFDILKKNPQRLSSVQQTEDPGNEIFYAGVDFKKQKYREGEVPPEYIDSIKKDTPKLTELEFVHNMLCASDWGVTQRNYQWVQRISEVENDYDIIIIWAGLGHLEEDLPHSLPYLLRSPNAMMVEFKTITSHMDEDDRELFEKGYELESRQCPPLEENDDETTTLTDEQAETLRKCTPIEPEKTYYLETERDLQKNRESRSMRTKAIKQRMAKIIDEGLEELPQFPAKNIKIYLE